MTLLSTNELADLVLDMLRTRCSASFGDGTGRWAPVGDLSMAVGACGYESGYGRVRGALEDLARTGRARRHPSGADFWQPGAP